MEKILITGGNGFVGKALVEEARKTYEVCSAVRKTGGDVAVGSIDAETDWSEALDGVSVVIHTAARVHVMNDQSEDPLEAFREVNVRGTANLARQASKSGVKRFVFISSIKVNGEGTELGQPFTESLPPAPLDPYGISKFEAEEELKKIASETGMEVVIVRPPLVYGVGVRANFLSLLKIISKGLPLPLGGIKNSRSIVARENLVDFVLLCVKHAEAANHTFLISDDKDFSTTSLIQTLARGMESKSFIFSIPSWLVYWGTFVLGKRGIYQRLFGSLQVSCGKAKELLGWKPKVDAEQSLMKLAKEF